MLLFSVYHRNKVTLNESPFYNKLDIFVPLFSSPFFCVFICVQVSTEVCWQGKIQRNMNSFIFLIFFSLVPQSKSRDDLPQIKVLILTKENKLHTYSSGAFVDVKVGERIYFTCQSKVPHRVVSSFFSQVNFTN